VFVALFRWSLTFLCNTFSLSLSLSLSLCVCVCVYVCVCVCVPPPFSISRSTHAVLAGQVDVNGTITPLPGGLSIASAQAQCALGGSYVGRVS
jgi:hypothetical protein